MEMITNIITKLKKNSNITDAMIGCWIDVKHNKLKRSVVATKFNTTVPNVNYYCYVVDQQIIKMKIK